MLDINLITSKAYLQIRNCYGQPMKAVIEAESIDWNVLNKKAASGVLYGA
tara:strand:- start:270 stop:419 length:150 start_codon:yes stop_codon:yes gene_type:complete